MESRLLLHHVWDGLQLPIYAFYYSNFGRFTGQEKLQPKDYVCSQCKTSANVCDRSIQEIIFWIWPQEATKQFSIRKLPPVLCIQLKVDIISMTPLLSFTFDFLAFWAQDLVLQSRYTSQVSCHDQYGGVYHGSNRPRSEVGDQPLNKMVLNDHVLETSCPHN